MCVYYTVVQAIPIHHKYTPLLPLSSPTLSLPPFSLPHSASLPASQGATGRSSRPAEGTSSAPHSANLERSRVLSSSVPGPSPGRHPHTQELASEGTGPRLSSQNTQLVSLPSVYARRRKILHSSPKPSFSKLPSVLPPPPPPSFIQSSLKPSFPKLPSVLPPSSFIQSLISLCGHSCHIMLLHSVSHDPSCLPYCV